MSEAYPNRRQHFFEKLMNSLASMGAVAPGAIMPTPDALSTESEPSNGFGGQVIERLKRSDRAALSAAELIVHEHAVLVAPYYLDDTRPA